jgi:hypothetical protein
MAEIINLRRLKKQRAREDAAAAAATNRARHGRTIGEREADRRDEARREKTLDHAKLGRERE